MTNPTPHGQVPEALRIADEFRECLEWDTIPSIIDIEDAADELRRLHAENEALRAQQDDAHDHGPQAETVEEAARDVGKWLNERPNRPLDLRHVAMLTHHAKRTAHVQNPAEIEHVAGDVSKNGAELNVSTQQQECGNPPYYEGPFALAQPVAQRGAADGFFLLLPQRPKPEAPAGTAGLDWDAYSGAQMLAFGRDCSDAAIAALRIQQPAPAGATYKDSTPGLHVGDSAFESWYSAYNPAHKADKQRARDAYAAGMGDPLVIAAPTLQPAPATQQAGEVEGWLTWFRTPSGGREPNYSHGAKKPTHGAELDAILTKYPVYAEPRPSPTAQAASSTVLKAIRKANMQLVRTGDNAFMLVPYKVATAQAAGNVPAISELPPLPDPDLRDVGTKPQDVKDFLNGYATEYARIALAARAPADSVPAKSYAELENVVRLLLRDREKLHRARAALSEKGGGEC